MLICHGEMPKTAVSSVGMESMGWLRNKRQYKRFTQGLNLKRNLLNGALLHVCAFFSVVPHPGRVSRERCLRKKETRRRVQRKYAMDSKSVRCWPANKVEPSVGLYRIIAPGIRYRITYTVPWFDMGCWTRLTVSVVLTTRHIFC